MKCPNCGAEIGNKRVCDYCDSPIPVEMLKEREQLNKQGCPNCGSTNITFKRENHGEIAGKNSKQIIHKTVGICKDCGHTWVSSPEAPKKRKTWLWVLGWIFIFPVPLTILMLRKKDMKPVLKYGIIAIAWLIYIAIGMNGNSSNEDANVSTETTEAQTTKETSTQKTKKEHIYDKAKIVDLMNGTGTEKIGTISVVQAKQSECTEEALLDWYNNYISNNKDCNYHVIVYKDNPDKGVYSTGTGFIQKDITMTKDSDGSYMLGDDAGSKYYSVSDDKTSLVEDISMADSSVVVNVKKKIEEVIPKEYQNSDLYSVDIAGEEGNLDCNITLVSEAFAEGNCQNVAEDLASKIKKLDLGIGYFSIVFQSNDYTMIAISSLDDLGNQDVSNIETQTY